MKHLLLLIAALGAAPYHATAQQPSIQCPGENTLDMRYCAEQSREDSSGRLQHKVPADLVQQWQQTTRAMCAAAYAPYRGGTIYPQLVVGCDDRLNRTLLKEFAPLNNQGDPEQAP